MKTTAERIRLNTGVLLDKGEITVLDRADMASRALEHRLATFLHAVPSHVVEDIKTQNYPADWWQHFKERWFPYRLLLRYPVKYREVRAHAKVQAYGALCPHLPGNRSHCFETMFMSAQERSASQGPTVDAAIEIMRALEKTPRVVQERMTYLANKESYEVRILTEERDELRRFLDETMPNWEARLFGR